MESSQGEGRAVRSRSGKEAQVEGRVNANFKITGINLDPLSH